MNPYLMVAIAAAVHFFVGMLWYSPLLFGKMWMKEVKMSEADMKKAQQKGMAKEMLVSFVSSAIMAYVTMHFLGMLSITEPRAAVELAAWIWLGFLATGAIHTVLWRDDTVKLYLINVGYSLVGLALVAVVLVSL